LDLSSSSNQNEEDRDQQEHQAPAQSYPQPIDRPQRQLNSPPSITNEKLPEIDEETRVELEWHKQLTERNKNNRGETSLEILQYKELLRTRTKLTVKKVLPADSFLVGIPEKVQGMITEFVELMKWCLE